MLAGGTHGGELGALGHQNGLGVGQDVGRLRRQDGHPEVQVVDHNADGLRIDRIGLVGDAAHGEVFVDDITVAVAVLDVGSAHTNEGLHVVGTKLNGVGAHALDGAQQAVVDRDLARAAFAEGKVALHVDELREHQRGVFDAGLNEGAACKVQVNRLGAGGHGQTLRAKALDEVDRRLGLWRALPAIAPVHANFDVLTVELEDVAAASDHKLAGRGLERSELWNDFGQIADRLHEGQSHIDVGNGQAEHALLIPDRSLGLPVRDAVAHKDVGIADAHQGGLDLHIGDGAPVARQLDVGEQARRFQLQGGAEEVQVTKAGACVDGDLAPRALLVGKRALNKNELADLKGGQADVNTEQGAVEVERDRRAASEH